MEGLLDITFKRNNANRIFQEKLTKQFIEDELERLYSI